MKPSTRTLVAVGLGLAVVNVAVAYIYRGRTITGQNKLLDLNDSLLKFNPLALLFPAAAAGSTAAASTTPTMFAPAPVAQVTDQSGGTTTYWG